MRAQVWIGAWQLQCCGQPLAVGKRAALMLSRAVDTEWLGVAIGQDRARSIDFCDECHDDVPRPTTSVKVTRIQVVSSAYAPRSSPGSGTALYPAEGTENISDVMATEGWDSTSEGHELNGYLLTVQISDSDALAI